MCIHLWTRTITYPADHWVGNFNLPLCKFTSPWNATLLTQTDFSCLHCICKYTQSAGLPVLFHFLRAYQCNSEKDFETELPYTRVFKLKSELHVYVMQLVQVTILHACAFVLPVTGVMAPGKWQEAQKHTHGAWVSCDNNSMFYYSTVPKLALHNQALWKMRSIYI